MHMRNTYSSLHNLQDFSLLKYRQKLIITSHFVLLSFHKQRFRCLSMNPFVEQVFVKARDFAQEAKPANQTYFDWSHKRTQNYNYQISQIRMPPKSKKKTKVSLQRMLLQPIPQTPVPQPYFNIPSPKPYVFPLSSTLLEGIKLLQNYFPDDINNKIRNKLHGRNIERMTRFKDVYCMMGKGGNGLLVRDHLMQMKGITAFAYGPTHLIVAFEDLRLQIYTMQLKLVKVLKNFSAKRINFLKLLAVPKTYESLIILANIGNKLIVYRIEKSFFSTLAVKLTQDVLTDLDFPVTYITQIPPIFSYYLQRDSQYRNTSLLAIAAINSVYILSINHTKLDGQVFWKRIFYRKSQAATCSTVSWGEANIQAPSRDMKGQMLIFNYSFDNQLYFVALRQIQKQDEGNFQTKCQWVQSYPFELTKRVVFCQQMKKSQVLLITQQNTVLVFHTKNFDIFEKALKQDQIEVQAEPFYEPLQFRLVAGTRRKQMNGATQDEIAMLSHVRYLSYADTFLYQYPSNQIYFLTQKQFGVYVYCNWKLISDLLKVQQKYECAMIFLIALYKKANRFDLGVAGQEKQLSEYIHMLCIDFINKKLGKIKQLPQIIENLLEQDDYLKMIVIPLEFLTETGEYDFLFEVVKDKIIASLTTDQSNAAYKRSQAIFFKVLQKFIEHGRIKYIPQSQIQSILKYFMEHDQLEMIDRLAIYFDLTRIDRNVVIQYLLQNNLVVSLAHICTQGNQSQFVTPFVKFWGFSQDHKFKKQMDFAAMYAFRALWYVKLCLQRNWILKQYSFDKYSKMIVILSQNFLGDKILMSLLDLRPADCLNTLSYYFTIQNSQIINENSEKIISSPLQDWIQRRQGNEKLEELLSGITAFMRKSLKEQFQQRLSIFLSSIIIYKTVRFTPQNYYSILINLIRNYSFCKEVNYGLQQKMLDEFMQTHYNYTDEEKDEILSARYITKILTLVFYMCNQFIQRRLPELYEESRLYQLTDLHAEISFLQGNFSNCIDIYVRSKKSAKNLLFEFLQNSFKRLVLQKKKQQKMTLANCIKRQIKYMVSLEPHKTKVLVQNYVPQIQQELIAALSDDEILQLEYLQGITNDNQRTQMKNKLSERSILRFVQLMAIHKPDNLIDAFKKNPHFSIEQSLKICERHEVYDCMEYLYERMGSIAESVKIAALRIDRILKTRNEYDEQNFAPYIKIKQILDNAIQVCKKNHSEEIWESLLDSSIQLYHKYKDSDLPQDQIQIFFYINGQIMQNLASNCTIEHTIELLQTKYTNLGMGGKMTKAFINILSNLSHSINILYISTNLIQISLQRVVQNDYQQKLHCYSTGSYCIACRYPLARKGKSVHFRCGHSYHQECAVAKDPVICVYCLGDRSDQFTYYLNTLNPQYPKIKKVNELLTKFEEKKFEMSQTFKLQEQETADKKEDGVTMQLKERKRNKLERFEDSVKDIEEGNWRVLSELSYYR